ncbi:MAG TPA: choice-of-anchor Q domain-containing protein [Abditibacteriaceae bacterium]|jgi:CSLREA domain-containing protein
MTGLLSAAQARTITVTTTLDPGVGGCTAAGTGDGCTLREAITIANNQTSTPGDDTIDATGISGTITLLSALPQISTNITLNGRGPANLTVQRSAATGTPQFRIFTISNTTTSGPTVVLSGLTISGGKVSGTNAAINSGGGIYNNHGTLTISNSVLQGNSATNGGAISNDGSLSVSASLTLSNSTITKNIATEGGGGLFNNGGSGGSAPLRIISCNLTSNSAFKGGALLNDGHSGGSATLTELSNSLISSNSASGNGGGIENDGTAGGSATLVASDTSFNSNTASKGGGINNNGVAGSATQAIRNCTFNSNTASTNGGAINNDGTSAGSATLTAVNSTFNFNTANADGGAVLNNGVGGSATVEIDSSTLKGNTASSNSAALDSDGTAGSATLALGSTILANSPSANILLTVNSETTFTSKNHNLSSDAARGDNTSGPGGPYLSAGGDIRNTNPQLDPTGLKDNGGPTKTIALVSGSRAINAGGSASTPAKDQRGYGRAGVADIGAYEFGGTVADPTAPTVTIKTPAVNGGVKELPAISGTASDNVGGSGLLKIQVALRRNSDKLFWNGDAWSTTATVKLAATLTGTSWTRNAGLPSGASLLPGSYVAYAYATDKAGNVRSTYNAFIVDRTLPNIAITTPANGATVTSLPSASGTTSDNSGGSGIARVQVALRRNSDKAFWNGEGWAVTATVRLPATFSGTAWTKSGGLPSGANLVNGTYGFYAFATDKAGNTQGIYNSFTVNTSGAQAAASPVTLSSASANADGTIRLVFTGELAATAADTENYTLVQNGAEIDVAGAQQSSASTVVLNSKALTTGQRLEVGYNLQDTQGRNVSGTASVLVR